MKKLIVISDFAQDPLYRQEFRSAVNGYTITSQQPYIHFVPVSSSSIQAGYFLEQIVRTEQKYGVPHEVVVYASVDPQKEMNNGLILEHSTGMDIVGPNVESLFSFIKKDVLVGFTYEPLNKETNFWSRKNYPRVLAHLMEYERKEIDLVDISLRIIPEMRGYFMCHIDSFGRIKTNITLDDMKNLHTMGSSIELKIDDENVQLMLTRTQQVEPCIFPGHSGNVHNPYMDISMSLGDKRFLLGASIEIK